jgi:plastocyanin
MRRRSALLATAALLAWVGGAGPARAETTTITMPGKYFDPPHSTAVAGDTVTFRNNDLVTHDVRIGGGVFDSGPIARFTSWSQQVDRPGTYPFICTLHAFMGGNLDVYAATLAASPGSPLAGEPLALTGRTSAGTAHVGVEQSVSGGAWSAVGAGAAPAPDGTFKIAVPAVEGASYRVSTPEGPGQVVTPHVTAHVDVHLMVERARRRTTVMVHTMPATTGLTATLELYSRWQYRWRAKREAKLDSHGRASFRLRAARRAYARVVLRRRARGPALVYSDVVKLWNGKVARDPNTLTPPGGGHHAGGGGGGEPGGGGHGGHG